MKKLFLGLLFMTNFGYAAEINVHYSRLGTYDNWNLWVWNEQQKLPGFEVRTQDRDDFGVVFKIDLDKTGLSNNKIGLLPRRGIWEVKDNPERYFTPDGKKDIYIIEGDEKVYFAPPEVSTKVVSVLLDENNVIRVIFTRPVSEAYVKSQKFDLVYKDKIVQAKSFYPAVNGALLSRAWNMTFDGCKFDFADIKLGNYKLKTETLDIHNIVPGKYVYDEKFYSDEKLGVLIDGDKTIVKVFAPKAVSADVLIYDSPAAEPKAFAMACASNGICVKNFDENLNGKYYKLRINQGSKIFIGLDPYAKSVTNDDGLGLIYSDTEKVERGPSFNWNDSILYEVHLRDLTVDEYSGAQYKGKYLGAAQEGTRHPMFKEVKTGLDHIAELGVNVVHIMPFQDFQNNDNFESYNWGYMPVNFNSPEGSYATKLTGLERVSEAKKMINAFHKKGIKVVMDVVYNHTSETPAEVYNFNAMSMDYYYRVNSDGSYSNGSGCGNEFNTEAPMGRKFIIDSLLHWMREYKVDGFRFDLMGLFDLKTVDEIVKELRKENPEVIIYGEPWTAGNTPTNGVKKGTQRSKGYSVFNDNLRDAIKGSVFNDKEKGYVQAGVNRDKVMRGIRGAIDEFTDSPLESLNYVSCHDNHTLWDRIDRSADASHSEKIKMDKLANAIVLTSQGIPFIHAGEEFLRTKNGEHNSYNLPDNINRLDWTRKRKYLDVFNYYKDLIKLRKDHKAFRMTTAEDVKNNLKFFDEIGIKTPGQTIAYVLYAGNAGDIWSNIIVLVNPERNKAKFTLPEGEWEIVFDENGLTKGQNHKVSGAYKAGPLSLSVLKR